MEHLNYRKGTGSDENWLISEERFDERFLGKCESIFCQGNGYLGVRHALEEAYPLEKRDMFAAGTFDRFHEDEVTELPNLPDVTGMELSVNGRPFSLLRGTIRSYERVMDLKSGEVTRTVEWQDETGQGFCFRFSRIVSMADEHVIAARAEVEPLDGGAEISVYSGIDGTVTNSGAQHFREGEKRLYEGRWLEMIAQTGQSGVTAGIWSAHAFRLDGRETLPNVLPVIGRRRVGVRTQFSLARGQRLCIEKISAVHTSRDRRYLGCDGEEAVRRLKEEGLAHIRALGAQTYEKLRNESAEAWEEIWKRQDVKIDSQNGFDQLALRFAVYHLTIMAKGDDDRVGIGAKGLTGEGYKGHSFWDTEVFILPYFLLTEPETARTLLEYRYRILDGARAKAKEYGYEGAMYPWESAWITDGEVTPLWGMADVVTGKPIRFLTGSLEQHITADIAFAVKQYEAATGDSGFMERCGYEILLDTARFWASRLEWKEDRGRYEITDVIGPDEYKEHVDNNAYTNYLAAWNMRAAQELLPFLKEKKPQVYARLKERLELEELEELLEERLKRLYLPRPEGEEGLIPQFEGYFDLEYLDLTKYKESSEVLTIYRDFSQEQINRCQVSKQGDLVVLFYLLEELFDKETRRRNYRYYEKRTLHDSSLSKCTHGVVACDLGMAKEAYRFYQGAAQVDLGQEMRSSDEGIHSAAMGGIWQAAVFGFGGVRIAGEKLRIWPVLPEEWSGLRFRIVWQGSPLEISADHSQVTVVNRGERVLVELAGRETVLEAGETVQRELAQPEK